MQQQNNSEVARLMAQIVAENEAAQRGMAGIAEGTARHKFIEAHARRMWMLRDKLSREVGENEATAMMCHAMLEAK